MIYVFIVIDGLLFKFKFAYFLLTGRIVRVTVGFTWVYFSMCVFFVCFFGDYFFINFFGDFRLLSGECLLIFADLWLFYADFWLFHADFMLFVVFLY